MSRRRTSSSGVALIRSVTMSVHSPKMLNRRSLLSSWLVRAALSLLVEAVPESHPHSETQSTGNHSYKHNSVVPLRALLWDSHQTSRHAHPSWTAHHCILPSPTSLETKYLPLPRKTR